MLAIFVGSTGFLCCFLYDWNTVKMQKKFLYPLFGTGFFLIAFSTGMTLWKYRLPDGGFTFSFAAWAAASLFFSILLIYTLFFALPFQETYLEENHRRRAYTEGVYALCRHPGVLWFTGMYLCLAAALRSEKALAVFAMLIGWNILYVWFQDKKIFPVTFSNYEEYQKQTPFLIPDRNSIRRCINGKKEA